MKGNVLIVLTLALFLSLSACTLRDENDGVSSGSSPVSETTEVGQEDASTPSPKMQSATFLIAGNNAQGTQLQIDIPESWVVDGDKIIANEQFVARFEIVSHYDSDAAVCLPGLIAEENGSDIFVEELDIPEMVVRYCKTQIENADGVMQDGLRYYICIENKIASISFVPATGMDMRQQCKEFETCLATLEIQF